MKPVGVHALVRRTHEERILAALREHGTLSRGNLARLVGLSRTTTSEITSSLLARGAIIKVDTDATSRVGSGRPAELLALDPASGQFMGVDFGHRRVHIAVADASHQVIASGRQTYDESTRWEDRLELAFALADRIAADTGTHYGALQGIGIGVPGPYSAIPQVHPGTSWGRRESATGLDTAFAERFGARVIVDNNTRFAALAEATETSDGPPSDVIYLHLSDGVGGGLVIGGRLCTGAFGLAGELGHVTADPAGARCRCGKSGCLETIASVPAILAACRDRGVPVETLDDLRREVASSHPEVEAVLRAAGAAAGRVLGSAAMVLNPASVVIGGAVVGIAPSLLDAAHSAIRHEMRSVSEAMPKVRAGTLTDTAGALGAIAAIFHESPLLATYAPADSRSPMTRSVS